MRVTSRVVCRESVNKNKTGTVMNLLEGDKPYYVAFDDGNIGEYSRKQLIEIDDITNSGYIDFKVGMSIYDTSYSMIGIIESIDSSKEEYKGFKVLFENGVRSDVILHEDFSFIVLE